MNWCWKTAVMTIQKLQLCRSHRSLLRGDAAVRTQLRLHPQLARVVADGPNNVGGGR